MKRFLLVIVLSLSACSSPAAPSATPAIDIPNYTIVGTYKMGGTSAPSFAYYVVVDKSLDTNRTALKTITNVLCTTTKDCQVTFWDDISKAATSPNFTTAQTNDYIAIYNRNPSEEQLSVCGLGEC